MKINPTDSSEIKSAFWSFQTQQMLETMSVDHNGLSTEEALLRLKKYGKNKLNSHNHSGNLQLFLAQFKNSIILILLFATGLSFYLGDKTDAAIIMTIILISGCLGFWQEKGATDAVKKLLALVQIKVNVLRDGKDTEIASDLLIPGDIMLLNAGDIIAGDCLVLTAENLFIDEAVLTGETFPVEKRPGVLSAKLPLSERTNVLWMGTHVQSGEGTALVVATGKNTEFGKLSERIKTKAPETEFERGIRHFGYLLMEVTLILVMLIFAFNVYLHRPVMESFLFALALAVGLTPQLLPAVISINLAHGAKKMAEHKVIVKQLASIENFGSMNVLCSDKTGTLTEGIVQMRGALGVDGKPNEKTALYAYLNSFYETGFNNPIDEAIREFKEFDIGGYTKLAEIPYDFYRKRLSLLTCHQNENLLITKGAFSKVLETCASVENNDGSLTELAELNDRLLQIYEDFSRQGFRTLGLAYKPMDSVNVLNQKDECGLRFIGFLLFYDPPKPDSAETIRQLKEMGVTLKIITGDNRLVASTISKQLGLPDTGILTGSEIALISEHSLVHQAAKVDIFAEVEPNQKEGIIIALKKAGYVVGYMGDGINDVSALHAADVGISVNSGADAAKETAEIVLLEKDLSVLIDGVREGRITFANTLKYVFMATSSNFGNMFSMAGASLFLPFLPLLPKQILMTNMLTDLPEMTIASDNVDPEWIAQPRRWDIKFIRKFMVTFGIVSSLFDYLTFGVLLLLDVPEQLFRTGWFTESVLSAALIVFVVRSSKPLYGTKPGKWLSLATFAVVIITLILPYSPIAGLAGFQPLPPALIGQLAVIVLLYIMTAELVKHAFYRRIKL